MLIGAEASDRTRRQADDSSRLLVPDASAIGPRSDVDRILENTRNRAVIFGRHEQNAMDGADLIAERNPWGRRVPHIEVLDRKSTRLNSSHQIISYAVFCLKKKNNK